MEQLKEQQEPNLLKFNFLSLVLITIELRCSIAIGKQINVRFYTCYKSTTVKTVRCKTGIDIGTRDVIGHFTVIVMKSRYIIYVFSSLPQSAKFKFLVCTSTLIGYYPSLNSFWETALSSNILITDDKVSCVSLSCDRWHRFQ